MPFFNFPIFAAQKAPVSSSSIGPYSTGVAYRGINRAGAEYGNDWEGWTGQTFYDIPNSTDLAAELSYLKGKGFNYIRLPISWERMQHSLNGPLNTIYRDAIVSVVNQCNAQGFRVCIDLHNYARYATGAFTSDQGTTQSGAYVQRVTGDGFLTFAHWADVWSKIATLFSSYAVDKVDYEMMNEPHDLPLTSEAFFAGVNAVIAAIRAVDTTHLIMVPNTRASDMDHWNVYSPGDLVLGSGNGGALDSVAALAVSDSANNFCFAMHGYQNTTVNQWTTATDTVTTWAQTNNRRLFLTEFGLNNTLPTGSTILSNFLTKLNNGSNVWLGWTTWNLESGTSNKYNVTAVGNYTTDGPAMPWYQVFLTPFGAEPPVEEPDTFPTNPATVTKNTTLTYSDGATTYYVRVPTAYDATHNTPMKLFVWMHGCGGRSQYDVEDTAWLSPSQNYILMCPGGAEGICWNTSTPYTNTSPNRLLRMNEREASILSQIANLRTRYNVSYREIFVGGYSSGGDIGYPMAFDNSNMFAGGFFCNTSPRYDSGMTKALSATHKMNFRHVAHDNDFTDGGNYSPASVQADFTTLLANGYTSCTLLTFPGDHWESTTNNSFLDRTIAGSTTYNIITHLLPFIDTCGWMSPGVTPPSPPVVPEDTALASYKSTLGVTETSWYVNTWADQSGNNRTFTANIEANPVQRLTGAFKGGTLASVYFPNFVTGLMRRAGGIAFTEGFAAFIVFKTQGVDTISTYAGNPPMTFLGDSTGSVSIGFGLSGGNVMYRHYSGSWQTVNSTGLSLNNGNVHTIAVQHNHTTGAITLWADGISVATGNITYNALTNIDSIGSGYNGLDQALDLNLAEVRMFNSFTDGQVATLHSAAIAEWV